ncbi:copper amine oxidase N-terminal domain-containing protein [Paenibacillus hunanensis]|uniref:Copper amine oxidase-like N-terminal domain-containing protein n=1 Tax=Paenibacillus hunanensis TaxID=539262 RepID=A0ABU1J3H7_9BACL|nr:copper amine oxidase N-terminal domain-containing protein [Paenibacillus hunanensis]MDR6246060.1 hypothetical protein [Paenibacillus hunanensis]GGJ13852.1 hypothetical protein GCM10008022_23540 [Paenibacillus hunanensis]
MKLFKHLSSLAIAATLLLPISNIASASRDFPEIYVNHEKLDIYAAVATIGVTYVPFRPIFEKLQMTVNWDNAKKSVTATNGTTTIVLTNNSYIAYVNDKEVQLLNPPSYNPQDGIFYVNLRFVAESTGATVNWSKDDQTDSATINITDPNLSKLPSDTSSQ